LSFVNAPIVETGRLTLRAHGLVDFDASVAMWSDVAVTRFIGGKPSSAQQTWSRLLTYFGLWALLGYGYWAIEEKATRRFIGEIGFADFKRTIAPSMTAIPELGWALASPAHGRGFATEAARAVTAWGDQHLAASRTVALIDPDNLASIRVAEKCGYANFERTTFNDRPMLFFERRSPRD
jgi:RimJ/RimL family protein N-acetyltransferase